MFAEQLSTAPPEDASRIQTNLTAVRANRAELINRYNADASREFTVGQFRDNDLPYQLNPDVERTVCAINQ